MLPRFDWKYILANKTRQCDGWEGRNPAWLLNSRLFVVLTFGNIPSSALLCVQMAGTEKRCCQQSKERETSWQQLCELWTFFRAEADPKNILNWCHECNHRFNVLMNNSKITSNILIKTWEIMNSILQNPSIFMKSKGHHVKTAEGGLKIKGGGWGGH